MDWNLVITGLITLPIIIGAMIMGVIIILVDNNVKFRYQKYKGKNNAELLEGKEIGVYSDSKKKPS